MKETQVMVRMSNDLRAGFKEYATTQGKTMSDILRDFMKSKTTDSA